MKHAFINFKIIVFIAISFISFSISAQNNSLPESTALAAKIANSLKQNFGSSITVKDSTIEYKKDEAQFSISIFHFTKGKSGLNQITIINNYEIDYLFTGNKELDRLALEAILKEKSGSSTSVTMSDDKIGSYPEIKFKGLIELCNFGCAVDGMCTLTVSGIEIEWGTGAQGKGTEPKGSILNASESQLCNSIGKTAEVYCRFIPFLSTIYGKTEYYIKVLN